MVCYGNGSIIGHCVDMVVLYDVLDPSSRVVVFSAAIKSFPNLGDVTVSLALVLRENYQRIS